MAASNVSLTKQVEKVFVQFSKEMTEQAQKALDICADYAKNEFVKVSPIDPTGTAPHYKDCWAVKSGYTNARFVGNTKRVDEIPLSNLLEYGRNGKPFILRASEQIQPTIEQIFVKEMAK